MDRHPFEHDGRKYEVMRGTGPSCYVRKESATGPTVNDLCAEILRLAEERDTFRRQFVDESQVRSRLEDQVAEQARTIERLRDDARMSRDVAEAALSDNRLLKGQVATLGAENYALAQKAKRRKAKIRKLKEELSVIGHQLEAARALSAQAEREAVLAYLENEVCTCGCGMLDGDKAISGIRNGAHHLTAPASPPQEPSPSGKSAQA